ncbi:transcription elongation factor GreA [Candidatus Gottesmanbacteria bacterium]|nr:transcription elongation factor GreA [Candidatus Gottesmanbacteria bacterium]
MNNTNQQKVLLTREGLAELKKEYEELIQVKRPVAVARMATSRDLGDLTENSEYTAARQDLAFIDGRIAELEGILHEAKLISVSPGNKGKVDVGCKVTLHVNGKKEIFTIVGEWEADPAEKKISHASPLGQALLGKKIGEKVEVKAPAGRVVYTILEIE